MDSLQNIKKRLESCHPTRSDKQVTLKMKENVFAQHKGDRDELEAEIRLLKEMLGY